MTSRCETTRRGKPHTPTDITLRRTLSSHALDALKDFYHERDTRAKEFEQLKAAAEEKAAAGEGGAGEPALKYPLSMAAFGEDWNKSQFWVRIFPSCSAEGQT